MPRVRFDGPAHRLIAYGKTVELGGFATFTDDEFKQLASQKNIHLTVIPTPKREKPQEPEAEDGEGQPAPNDQKE